MHASDHAYTKANTKRLPQESKISHDVILPNYCMTNFVLHRCRKVPNNMFSFWTKNKKNGSTSKRQSKFTPLFEISTKRPQVKHNLFVFWLSKFNSVFRTLLP